ncbi:biotin/lipoyl-binding protein [Patescibacteria group bacterium]|nr:biotin/lipoyl-binding protein [Patescibacteria group bacterium]MBU4057351.1 biotin/lipoyl-binding protein [Patescibacteria group bacterium]MBU4115820.1 biotin/lipoyl-binding protein [Patescibacteria group bacterium]
MQNIKTKIKNFFKKKSFKIIIGVVVVIIILFILFGGGKEELYEFIITEKGSLIQEVDVTGRIKPVTEVELAFKNSGKIGQVYVDVRDRVFAGQILLRLDNADSYAQLQWAEAQLKAQEAKLDELKRGSRPEEIQIQIVKVDNAKRSLNDAKQGVIDKIQDGYIKSDDAIRNKADQLFNNPRSDNPDLKLSNTGSQSEIDLEWKRFIIEKIFSPWKTSLDNLSMSSNLESEILTAKKNFRS